MDIFSPTPTESGDLPSELVEGVNECVGELASETPKAKHQKKTTYDPKK